MRHVGATAPALDGFAPNAIGINHLLQSADYGSAEIGFLETATRLRQLPPKLRAQ